MYRLYTTRDGHIVNRTKIDADNDDAAMALALQQMSGATLELWHGSRRLAVIAPPTSEAA